MKGPAGGSIPPCPGWRAPRQALVAPQLAYNPTPPLPPSAPCPDRSPVGSGERSLLPRSGVSGNSISITRGLNYSALRSRGGSTLDARCSSGLAGSGRWARGALYGEVLGGRRFRSGHSRKRAAAANKGQWLECQEQCARTKVRVVIRWRRDTFCLARRAALRPWRRGCPGGPNQSPTAPNSSS